MIVGKAKLTLGVALAFLSSCARMEMERLAKKCDFSACVAKSL
jgi:hypothetical protein